MRINWSQVWAYLYGNRVAIGGGFMLIVTAAVKTAPVPRNVYLLWVYDWFHQTLNITNTRLNTQPIVTPPENTASPK